MDKIIYSPKEVYKKIHKIMTWNKKLTWLAILGAILTSLLYYGVFLLDGLLMYVATEGAVNKVLIWQRIIIIFLLYCCTRIPTILGYKLNSWSAYKLGGKMQSAMIEKWLKQEEVQAREQNSSVLLNRIISDGEAIQEFFFQGLGLSVIEPFIIVICALVTIVVIEWRLAIFLVVIGCISSLCSALFSKSIHRLSSKAAVLGEESFGIFSSIVSGNQTIHNLGIENKISNNYIASLSAVAGVRYKVSQITKAYESIDLLFQLISLCGCLALASWLSIARDFYFPMVMIVIPMQNLVSKMLGNIGKAWNCSNEISIPVQRISEIMEMQEENKQAECGDLKECESQPLLVLDSVKFTYDTDIVADDISLTIKQGEKVAIIGFSGSGKSSLLNIIMGFFTLDSGEVLLWGQNQENVSVRSWRSKIALVQQENPLLNMSIEENISLSCLQRGYVPSREQVTNAAKMANAHEFIISLPQGYDTKAGELGNMLSGGQRQRIALARAFISKAPLILLDEPTSSLDAENERILMEAINKIGKTRTIILATHRLGLVEEFDCIYLMSNGKLVEKGTHMELMSNGQVYRQLRNNV